MRQKLVAGIVLSSAPVLVVLISAGFDLDLEAVALLGVALGAVAALVPDRSPMLRLGGFAAGASVGWVGFVVRAAALPDTSTGRAVAAALVVLVCVAIALAVRSLPLWALLLGAGAVVGAYEARFSAAPTEVLSSSFSTMTALLMAVGLGFLAASGFAPTTSVGADSDAHDDLPRDRHAGAGRTAQLDHMMEPPQ